MAYTKFDPKGQKPPEQSFLPRRFDNPFVVFFQLLGLFALVRVVMIGTGVLFIRIPYFDYWLWKLMHLLKLI